MSVPMGSVIRGLILCCLPALVLAGGRSRHPIQAHYTPERLAALASGQICTGYYKTTDCTPVQLSTPLPSCGGMGSIPDGAYAFAIIGDYGIQNQCEKQIANLTSLLEQQYGPYAFVMTTGDNAYYTGACDVYQAVLPSYAAYVSPNFTCVDPTMDFIMSSLSQHDLQFETRFWPTLGNHDWDKPHVKKGELPYTQAFPHLKLQEPKEGLGLYYTRRVTKEIQIFSLNSNIHSSDPEFPIQQIWLKGALNASDAPHKWVFYHHATHTTAQHDPIATWMDWDYQGWGATAVFNGHQHVYERLQLPGQIPYIVNGLGGNPLVYDIHGCTPYPGSQLRYNENHGMLIGIVQPVAKETGVNLPQVDFCFYSTEKNGLLVDHWTL